MATPGVRHRHTANRYRHESASVPDLGSGSSLSRSPEAAASPTSASERRIASSADRTRGRSSSKSSKTKKVLKDFAGSANRGAGARALGKYNCRIRFSSTSRSASMPAASPIEPSSAVLGLEVPSAPPPLPYLESQLFEFCKISLGDFESCLSWLTSHPPSTIDYTHCKEKILWQTYKTFERLLKQDFEERCMGLVKSFAEQCVRTLAILDYTADCGWEKGKEYARHLVLTPEMARMNYLSRMMSLPPQERLGYINRPVPGHLQKLKFFCMLYDHLYEKIEQEARHRMEKTLLDKFQTRLETVQARLSKGLAEAVSAATAISPVENGPDVGRAF